MKNQSIIEKLIVTPIKCNFNINPHKMWLKKFSVEDFNNNLKEHVKFFDKTNHKQDTYCWRKKQYIYFY